jgi:tetratricopeptide (TPR) repeat protein
MADWKLLPDEELARRGRDLVRRGHYALGNELLSEYCSRLIAQDRLISPPVMAAYGLSVGMTGDLAEGLETCQRALAGDRRSAEIWASIARLALLAGAKKKAVEAASRALALAPHSRELLALRRQLGVRRRPAIPFLPRENPINVRLGRLLHRLSGRDRAKPVLA